MQHGRWAAALNHALGKGTPARLIAIADADALTLIGGDDQGFDSASVYVPGLTGQHADSLLARQALMAGIHLDDVVRMQMSSQGDAGAAVPFGLIAEALP